MKNLSCMQVGTEPLDEALNIFQGMEMDGNFFIVLVLLDLVRYPIQFIS